jgi:CHAT domain-containing protein
VQVYARILIWVILFYFSFVVDTQGNNYPCAHESLPLYNKANKLFNHPNPTDETDKQAFVLFQQLIDKLQNSGCKKAMILFHSYVKKGIILDILGRHNDAKNAYLEGIGFYNTNRSVSDSLILRLYIYTGSSYYRLNDFDSARFFLRKAEAMINLETMSGDKARLYNALGALYYDNGNYNQSKNYFRQALAMIQEKKPLDTVSAVNISTNIATAYYKLGDYKSSLTIYHNILKYNVSANYIYMNMGRANAGLNQFNEALNCFRKVNPMKLPGVYNEIAAVQLKLNLIDSSIFFLDKLQFGLKQEQADVNDLDVGINQLYRAELYLKLHQYEHALRSLQKAIMLFANFKNPDIYTNPSGFKGAFAYYRLFDALSMKATVFELLFKKSSRERDLKASYDAYVLTLELLEYIEKNYDTDDAKLLLKKSSREIYEKAISVCIKLHNLHPGKNYLEKAFLTSERNKGSVVVSNLRDQTLSRFNPEEAAIADRTRNIKYNIARLNVKQDQSQDTKEIERIAVEKEGYEMELSRLHKQMEQNNRFFKLKYNDSYPALNTIQENLTREQALISFYSTPEKLHVFIVTRKKFQHHVIDSWRDLQQSVASWIKLLQKTESGRKFKGQPIGNSIYKQLVEPIRTLVPQSQEWIIIPDGVLYFLPFESLPVAGRSESLVESLSISYQLSSRFVTGQDDHFRASNYSVLAFAPFANTMQERGREEKTTWNRLPASAEEIKELAGSRYIDNSATKEQFLKEVNSHPVIHLATHAVANINNAAGSYIAFYPQNKSLLEDRLYLEELYGLKMDATKLVIISACETGEGELINNEGVMSVARAFAYAGCASSINSLWKADDRATCEILKRFHFYLQKGFSKSRALQKAKIDYIKRSETSKNPGYWSNLILVGDNQPICNEAYANKELMLFFMLPFFVIAAVVIKKSRRIHK